MDEYSWEWLKALEYLYERLRHEEPDEYATIYAQEQTCNQPQ